MAKESKALRVGYGDYVYEHVPGWGKLPDGWEWNHAVGVGVDAQDRVFVYNRSDHPMIVLDKDGNVLDNWGEGQFGIGAPPGRPGRTAACTPRTWATIPSASGQPKAT